MIFRNKALVGLGTFLTAIVISVAVQAEPPAGSSSEYSTVEFNNDLIPLLTKHGCNTGACHGAAIGRGGLKLSLYGGNPSADYDALVRELGGRRVNVAHPEQSLALLKPTGQVEHGGGTVFDSDDENARLFEAWIAQGATNESSRRLTQIKVVPSAHIAKSLGDVVRPRVIAQFSNQTQRDVTRWAIFKADDDAAITVASSPSETTLTLRRRGRHIVVVRYLHEVIPVELILPVNDAQVDFPKSSAQNLIDEKVLARLRTLRLPPSPQVGDASFLRRVSLDLTGRLPKPDVVRRFEAENRPNKREAIIDELLGSEAFNQYWTLQFAKLLRIRTQRGDSQATRTYHRWLESQIAEDVSYRELARRLILATGDSHQNGPANFHRTVVGPRDQAEFFSELFMASRLRCANCHNHPLDQWTQDDYHGLAAIFAKLDRGQVVSENAKGQTIHPRTLEPATPFIPGERSSAMDSPTRRELADWLTSGSNPYFAKAIVNRLWKHMMGRGLVEPVDDFRATNPATHPELLQTLAEDFAEHGYRLRHTLKAIATSDAYARSSKSTSQNRDDNRFYSHALRRPLEPETLADAISDVLGVPEQYTNHEAGVRAVALIDPQTPSRSLDILGRCDRKDSCESVQSKVSGLSQKLHLFNGDLLNRRITADGGRLSRMLQAGESPSKIIEEFYLAALSRRMTDVEREHWDDILESTSESKSFLEDFVWAIVSSRDFVTNH